MRMIEAVKVPPLIRLLLMKHPYADVIMEQMQYIIDEHTIDAVPVVRCRDCKYHRIVENKKNFMYWHNCELWCANIDEDDFCSYGERKDGDR